MNQSGGCPNTSPIEIPTWYKYLQCDASNTPQFNNINDVWLIALAVFEIVVYLGSVAAVIFMIYGGIQFITSQGNPENISKARRTITYAIAGLFITIISRAIVIFIGNSFGAPDVL